MPCYQIIIIVYESSINNFLIAIFVPLFYSASTAV